MSNESNLKLKVKVDSSELDKLSSKLKGINTVGETGTSSPSASPVVQKIKTEKAAVEELTASQKFAAEATKILSEEQNQLATNVDSAEIAQKAIGAALQNYLGISAAAIGVTLAMATVTNYAIESALKYNEELRLRGRELSLLGISEREYQAILRQGSNLEAIRSNRLASLGQGFILTGEQTRMTAAAVVMFSDVLGGAEKAQQSMEQALAGSTDAMRSFGFTAAEGSTKEQAFRGFLSHIAALERTDHEARIRIRSEVNARALSTDSERYKQIMIDGQYREYSANQNRILQETIRAAQERYRIQADLQTQFSETQKQREVRNAEETARAAAAAALGQSSNLRSISGSDLGRNLAAAWNEVNVINQQIARTEDQRIAKANALVAANQRVSAINEEINRRALTASGIRETLQRQAITRALAAGASTQQLERVSISNAQIRTILEAKLVELKERLRTATGQEAQLAREAIVGLVSEIKSITPTAAKALISLTEIRDMVLQAQRASEEFSQNEFIRAIQRGTVSIEEQMNRFSELSDRRRDTEARYRETLYQTDILQARIEEARTSRERQRNAELLRKTNEEAGRLHTILGQVNSEYEAVSQAISRQNQEEIRGLLSANLDADKRIYDSSTNRLQNQSRDFQVNLGQQRSYVEATIALLDGSASDYQRTIANLFSPEELQASFGDIVRNATDTLENERTRLEQLRTSGASNEALMSQEQRVADAARNQAQATREAAQAQADLNQRMRESSFGGQFAKTMTNNAKGLAIMGEYAGGIAAKGLNLASDAIWAGIDALKSGEEVGPALAKMLSATLQSIGQEATVRALMETAAGFAALANPVTVPLAGGHFAAAAVYASVATAAGVGYAALPSPPEKGKKEKEKEDKDREFLNAQRKEQTIILNGSAIMTKEERAKFIRELSSYGKNL